MAIFRAWCEFGEVVDLLWTMPRPRQRGNRFYVAGMAGGGGGGGGKGAIWSGPGGGLERTQVTDAMRRVLKSRGGNAHGMLEKATKARGRSSKYGLFL